VAASVDSFYPLFTGALIFSMQVGFVMLLTGSIYEKNISKCPSMELAQ
jgi:hypothetical protein